MAGGVGSRFWPVSTQENPKQFHDMLGIGESLIQNTFSRLKKIIPKEIINKPNTMVSFVNIGVFSIVSYSIRNIIY